jgi:hypothetical protein
MASVLACARALMDEESGQEAQTDARRGIDRVLLATFWRPSPRTTPALVIPITTHTLPRR